MANEWAQGLEIRFYSAWIGCVICLVLLYPLSEQLKYRVLEYKENQRALRRKPENAGIGGRPREADEESATATSSSSSDKKKKKKKKKGECTLLPPLILLGYAFLCVGFAIIHLVLVGVFMSEPQRTGVTKLTDAACAGIYWIIQMSYNLSFYFFTIFMLYRIKIVFTEPLSVRLSSVSYAVLLIAINLLLVLKIVFGLQSKYVWNAELAICSYIINRTVLIYFWYTKYLCDSLLVLILSFMFTRRLWVLTRQNPKVNALITRTIVCGLIASITSLVISLGKLCGASTEYFVNLDEVINCICVVFSYKVTCCKHMQFEQWKGYIYRQVGGHGTVNTQNEESQRSKIQEKAKLRESKKDMDQHAAEQQIYVQPPDHVVMEELFGADDNYEQDDAHCMHVDEEALHLHGHNDVDHNGSIMHGHDTD